MPFFIYNSVCVISKLRKKIEKETRILGTIQIFIAFHFLCSMSLPVDFVFSILKLINNNKQKSLSLVSCYFVLNYFLFSDYPCLVPQESKRAFYLNNNKAYRAHFLTFAGAFPNSRGLVALRCKLMLNCKSFLLMTTLS